MMDLDSHISVIRSHHQDLSRARSSEHQRVGPINEPEKHGLEATIEVLLGRILAHIEQMREIWSKKVRESKVAVADRDSFSEL